VTITIILAGAGGVLLAIGLADLAAVLTARRRPHVDAADAPRRAARWAALLARLGRRVGVPAAPRDLDARLAAAGLAASVRTADAMAIKAGAGVAAALLAAPILSTLPLRLTLVLVPLTAAAGFLTPDLWLRRRARRRADRAGLELADILDLLRVAVAAGLPTGRALAEVGRRHGGVVATELRVVAQRLELGMPRTEALGRLHRALPVPAIGQLTAAIARADRHGAPLGPALTALALEARADRARALHDQAARAAPRIQLAIALLLVPAVLLVVAAGLAHGLS
jgi:tight adherence protein C